MSIGIVDKEWLILQSRESNSHYQCEDPFDKWSVNISISMFTQPKWFLEV